MCDTIAIINHGRVIASESKDELLARLDYRKLRIAAHNVDLISAPTLLGLGAVIAKDGRIEIDFRSSEHSFEEMLERVKSAGIDVNDISIIEPDLEDVFVHLTAAP